MPAIDAYIYLDGVQGEARENGSQNHIEIQDWHFGISPTIHITDPSAKSAADTAKLAELTVKKAVDKAEDWLRHFFSSSHQGTQNPTDKVKFTIHKTGDSPPEYLRFSFEDLIITSPRWSSGGGDAIPSEEFKLNFTKIKFKYEPQSGSDTPSGAQTPTNPQTPQTPPTNQGATKPMNLLAPDYLAAGDVISGTVLEVPVGQGDSGPAQNATELQGIVVEVDGHAGANPVLVHVPLILPGTLFGPTLNTGTLSASGSPGTTSQTGQGGSFNEVRFEDNKGSELITIHAEKNQDIEVEHDEAHWVGHDRTRTIDHDETTHVKHERTETLDNNGTITIHGSRTETVDRNESITIHGSRTETVGANETITISTNRSELVRGNGSLSVSLGSTLSLSQSGGSTGQGSTWAGKSLAVMADEQITLKTGDSSITMKKDGNITVGGRDITISGSGATAPKGGNDLVLRGCNPVN
jgi:type VI protein secretion system component Hcp